MAGALEGHNFYKVVAEGAPYRNGSFAGLSGGPLGKIYTETLFFEGSSESTAWKMFELACADERIHHVVLYADDLGRRAHVKLDSHCQAIAIADLRYRLGLTGKKDYDQISNSL